MRFLILAILLFTAGCCDEKSVPKMKYDLYSSDAGERNKAALALARCGTLGESSVPRLAELLYDSNVGVQSSAAYALQKIDSAAAREALQAAMDAR